jgi:predicted helicase
MRKHIKNDFSTVLVIDLGGDVRSNPKLSGTTNNVFGIQVGVAITLFIRNRAKRGSCEIKYVSTGTYWRKEQKYSFLNEARSVSDLDLATIVPDGKSSWITDKNSNQFFEALCISADPGRSIFEKMSNGIKTNRDAWAYSFSPAVLASNIQKCVDFYNAERSRWIRAHLPPESLDDFLKHDDQPNYVDRSISWSRGLRNSLLRDVEIVFDSSNIRRSRYRPFTTQSLYFDPYLTEERLKFQRIFPVPACEKENMVIAVTGHSQIPFSVQVTDCIPCVDVGGRPGQCFPFYMYDGDGSNRRENITDWALEEFRKHYADSSITKWDIFHYTYALLHSPEYRESYAANLKHELPRIPFAPNFRAFADAGKRLAEFHVNYEQQPEYPLEQIWKPGSKLDMRVERMRLGKDKASLIYNDSLTLSGIPAETFEYRLGNRSALDWVIDQYQVSTDKRSGITNDPNREDDPEYILRLIGQVIFVSLETVKIVNALPELGIGLDEKAHT